MRDFPVIGGCGGSVRNNQGLILVNLQISNLGEKKKKKPNASEKPNNLSEESSDFLDEFGRLQLSIFIEVLGVFLAV